MRDLAAIVLFGGPGGVCTGLRDAGVSRMVSVENDSAAVATARAAGHQTFQADVRQVDPHMLAQWYRLTDTHLLVQSSPPCQGLSPAGKGKGREDAELLFAALDQLEGLDPRSLAARVTALRAWLEEMCSDERSPLTFETIRWIARLTPEYVVLEQVPTALGIWRKFAEVLETWGYSVWCGYVFAEQYGVPQARKRAILMASRVSEVSAPVPTHSKYHRHSPAKLDADVLHWVSMAEALGYGIRREVEAAVEGDTSWVFSRPSPTIVGSFAPDVVAAPGYRKAGDPPRQKTPGSVRITLEDGAVLQGFPADYPFQGAETKRWQQIGNAVPPLLTQRLVEGLCKSERVAQTPEVAA